MRILYLPIKRKWLNMILDGTKTEDYRAINEYWGKRIKHKAYEYVCLHNYRDRYLFEYKGWTGGNGRPEWGAEVGKDYYIIFLGKFIGKIEKM